MKNLWILALLFCLAAGAETAEVEHARKAMADLPVSFEPNLGQAGGDVRFLARAAQYTLYLTESAAVFRGNGTGGEVRMEFAGGNRTAKLEALDSLPGISNYFLGSQSSQWRTNIPNYARIAWRNVYPGIDLILYGRERQVEYDWVIAPGADPRRIRVKFSGARGMRLDPSGDVVLAMQDAEIRHLKPVVYQMDGGRRRELQASYEIHGGELGFRVASYDPHQTLVIDPAVRYATYLGGLGLEQATGIAVDPAGNVYVTGSTTGQFPVVNALQQIPTSANPAFVAKLNSLGQVVYATYLGGLAQAEGFAIAVDANGNAYLTGVTNGDFPLQNPVQPIFGGASDAFVAELSPQGNQLLFSTYLGGSGSDAGYGIGLDRNLNVYVAGSTTGGFPVTNAVQSGYGGGVSDAFALRLNTQASAVIYSTYLGGAGQDAARAIATDLTGNAYITGITSGAFPYVSNLYGGGPYDAFVTKLNPQGGVVYGFYLGGPNDDQGLGIAVDVDTNVCIAGVTRGPFPLTRPLQPDYGGGGGDAFLVKVNSSGTIILYSTYIGGTGRDIANAVAADASGNCYVTGLTTGDFPLLNSSQSIYGGGPYDAFVAGVNPQGSALLFSTYLGGIGDDRGTGIAVDFNGNGAVYVMGMTSGGFPVANAYQPSFGGNEDAFVAALIKTPPDTGLPFGSFDTPLNNTMNVSGSISITGWALDNVGITRVGIYRESVPGEPAGLVFIGNATLVPGSRPDVQAAYPNYPNSNRGGWGYQLLTNYLVNGNGTPGFGNGTYKLHAIAFDAAGNFTELTRIPGIEPVINPIRTITVDNADGTKPFGTIDTPAQGETISGTHYVNFGWALTPGALFRIPFDGSTITVMIDGVAVGHPVYNQYRSDIYSAFPGYTNCLGAVGYFVLDTTKLANGLHTISWIVSDDHGRSDGIGSRYFIVSNAIASSAPPEEPISPAAEDAPSLVEMDQSGSIELHLGAADGHMLVAGERETLPVGSTLKGGVFYWQPGPGFLGDYELEFTRPNGDRVPVDVRVRPKNFR